MVTVVVYEVCFFSFVTDVKSSYCTQAVHDDVIVHYNRTCSDNILACGRNGSTRLLVGRHEALHSHSLVHIWGKISSKWQLLLLVIFIVTTMSRTGT